jgi:hypothetical protein
LSVSFLLKIEVVGLITTSLIAGGVILKYMDGSEVDKTIHSFDPHSPVHDVPTKPKPMALKIAAVIIGLVVVLVVIYISFFNTTKKAPAKTTSTQPTILPLSTINIPSPKTSYYSTNLGVGFNYPSSWTVTDVSGSNQIVVSSPMMKLVNSSDKLVSGKTILTIIQTPPTPTLSGFSAGNAVAALPSQIINYSDPTPDQKGSTYISFLHYASSKTPLNSIDGIYVTGNTGYLVNQYSLEADIFAVSPIIYFSFVSCQNISCSTTTQLSMPSAIWQNSSFAQPILTMLESISVS